MEADRNKSIWKNSKSFSLIATRRFTTLALLSNVSYYLEKRIFVICFFFFVSEKNKIKCQTRKQVLLEWLEYPLIQSLIESQIKMEIFFLFFDVKSRKVKTQKKLLKNNKKEKEIGRRPQ